MLRLFKQTCSPSLPDTNSEWNNSSTYSQTRNWSARSPTKTTNYNEATTSNDCRFRC